MERRGDIPGSHWAAMLVEVALEDVIQLVAEHNEVVAIDIADVEGGLAFDVSEYFPELLL